MSETASPVLTPEMTMDLEVSGSAFGDFLPFLNPGLPQSPPWELIQMPPLVTSAIAPCNPLVPSTFPTMPVVAGTAGHGPCDPGPCKVIIQVSSEVKILEPAQNQSVTQTQAPPNQGATEAPSGHPAPLYLASSVPKTVTTTPATTVTQSGMRDHLPHAPPPEAQRVPTIFLSCGGIQPQWFCGDSDPVPAWSQAPPEDSCRPSSVYENFQRWKLLKALTRKYLPRTPDTEVLSCFLIPVLRTLARLKPTMSLEEGLRLALREWRGTSNFDRMIYYDMAAKFKDFEDEEEMEVQKPNRVQGLSPPTSPRPELQEAPGTPPAQQPACVPNTDSLCDTLKYSCPPETDSGHASQPERAKATVMAPGASAPSLGSLEFPPLQAGPAPCPSLTAPTLDSTAPRMLGEAPPGWGSLGAAEGSSEEKEELTCLAFHQASHNSLLPSGLPRSPVPDTGPDTGPHLPGGQGNLELPSTRTRAFKSKAPTRKGPLCGGSRRRTAKKTPCPRGHPRVCRGSALTEEMEGPSLPPKRRFQPAMAQRRRTEHKRRFNKFEDEEEMEVQKPDRVQGLPHPTPLRPELQEAPGPAPAQQPGPDPAPQLKTTACVPNTDSLCAQEAHSETQETQKSTKTEDALEIPPEAVQEYIDIMDELLKAPDSDCRVPLGRRVVDRKEQQEEAETWPEPGILSYMDELCSQEAFVTKAEAILHPSFLEYLVSPNSQLDLLALAEELEKEEGLTPTQIVEKRLQASQDKKVMKGRPQHQMTLKDSCPPETDSRHTSWPGWAEATVMAPGASVPSLGSLESPPLQAGLALCPSVTASTLDSRAPRMLGEAPPDQGSLGAAEGSSEEKDELTCLAFLQASHNSLLPSGLPRSPVPDTGPNTGPHLPGGQGNLELPSTRTRAFKSKAPTRKSPLCRRPRRRTAEKTTCPKGHPRVSRSSALTEELEGPSLPPKRRFQPAMAQRRRTELKRQ